MASPWITDKIVCLNGSWSIVDLQAPVGGEVVFGHGLQNMAGLEDET